MGWHTLGKRVISTPSGELKTFVYQPPCTWRIISMPVKEGADLGSCARPELARCPCAQPVQPGGQDCLELKSDGRQEAGSEALTREPAHFLCKGPNRKYSRLGGPYSLGSNYSTLPLPLKSRHCQKVNEWGRCVPIHTCLKSEV